MDRFSNGDSERAAFGENALLMECGRYSLFFPLAPFYILRMPSFDIVSEVNSMEIENAVNQAKKELANRFDFKGSKAEILLDKNEIKLSAEDQFKIKALEEIVIGKLAKRGVSPKNIDRDEPDVSPLGHARQTIRIKPPLCLTQADADFALEVLDAAFTKFEAQVTTKPQPAMAAA